MIRTIIAAVAAATVAVAPASAFTQYGIFAPPSQALKQDLHDLVSSVGVSASIYVVRRGSPYRAIPMLSDMPSNALGYASRTIDGECFIFIRSDIADVYYGRMMLAHEYSHCVAWERHGVDISSHGQEFTNVCRGLATNSRSCKSRFFKW